MGINTEYYEAVKIDGANIFQQIRHITIPSLVPTFIMLFLFSLGSIMRGQFIILSGNRTERTSLMLLISLIPMYSVP